MRISKKHSILFSVLLIVLGVVVFIYPGSALNAVCRVIGIFLLFIAGIGGMLFYQNRENRLSGGFYLFEAILSGLAGIIFLVNPAFIAALLPLICGLAIAANGVGNLLQTLEIKRALGGNWTLHFILASATTALGVLIFANPFATMALWVKILGVILIYDGASNIITARSLL